MKRVLSVGGLRLQRASAEPMTRTRFLCATLAGGGEALKPAAHVLRLVSAPRLQQQYATRVVDDKDDQARRRTLGGGSGSGKETSRPAAGSAYDRRDLEDWLHTYRVLPVSERSTPAALADILQRRPRGVPAVVCCNALLNEGARDNNMTLITQVHEAMAKENIAPTVVTYNTLIKGYLGSASTTSSGWPIEERLAKARSLMHEMRGRGLVPNARTYNALISVLAERGQADAIDEALADLEKDGVEKDVFLYNSVLQGYGRAGKLDKMEQLFERLQSTGEVKPSGVTYHVLMDGFAKLGKTAKMLDYWALMKQENRKRRREVDINVRTYTILLAGFGESGDKEAMMRVWGEMKGKPHTRPNKIAYGCLIDCLGRMGAVEDMLDVYREAKQQSGVTEVVYNHVLTHLGKSGKIEQAEEVFDEMKRDTGFQPNAMLYNVMLDLYAKAVLADKAESLYREMLDRRLTPTRVTFTSLIEAESRAGRWNRIESIIRRMEDAGVQQDAVVLNVLIDAYGFMGQPDRGEEVVEDLLPASGLTPDANHLASLVEAWARNGRMDKAEQWLRRAAEVPADDEQRSKALRAFVSFCGQQLVGHDKEATIQRARNLFAQQQQHEKEQ